MTLLVKRSGRDDKTPSERIHCPEVILESEGGSGRVVGHSYLGVISGLPVTQVQSREASL
jgi:hypothetical protein